MGHSAEIKAIYGNKLRIRVCGILENHGNYLFVNHKKLNTENIFWNFPGGGVDDGESISETLVREFKEEVNLNVSIEQFCFFNEVIVDTLHAIELYFKVKSKNFDAKTGQDPELEIITDHKWMTIEQFSELPTHQKPVVFSNLKSINDLINRFQN
ncbi:NUDIX domain-containing protein [Lacihabitans soyangensis]|nr:NUDIX hydrolase [Lacihabitans soyangensis]